MGRNEYGRLGLGSTHPDASEPTPLPSPTGKKAIQIAAGECVSFFVTEDGKRFTLNKV